MFRMRTDKLEPGSDDKKCFKVIDEKIERKVECKPGRNRMMKNHKKRKTNPTKPTFYHGTHTFNNSY